jgi:hypothetical protein
VLEWLNTNFIPELLFENLSDKIPIIESDMEFLLENSFLETINEVFIRTIYNISETENPIFAFAQKTNIFYIYENEAAGWSELSREKFVKFLDRIYIKISKAFSEWKKNNKDKMDNDENFQIQCDKTSVKMYSVDIKNEITLGKIKTCMYSRMKTDMKAFVEYEFEF